MVTHPQLRSPALFGVGWGLGGYCPGPGVVSLVSGATPPIVFVLAMLGGAALGAGLDRARSRPTELAAEP